MENTEVLSVNSLLTRTIGVIKKYKEIYRHTGAKYNFFKIARIDEDEVEICRFIADLLNPQGLHYKGNIYLELFKENVLKNTGVEVYQELDTKRAVVETEHYTDKGKRIDIAIQNQNNIFIPIEAKIKALDSDNQISHYWEYAKKINGKDVPVLYLTKEGSEPRENSVKNSDKYKYKCISFSKNILSWLEACLKCSETITTPPIREIIVQLIATIKSFCGIMEDAEMDKEISKLIMESEDTIRAALAIKDILAKLYERWELFKGPIFNAVKDVLPNARVFEKEDGWDAICVWVKNSKYALWLNYEWTLVVITREDDNVKPDSMEEKRLADKMSEITGVQAAAAGTWIWQSGKTFHYPGLENVGEDVYPYQLHKQYSEHPEEVAQRIISIAQALENA
jgi:hypothetical protein